MRRLRVLLRVPTLVIVITIAIVLGMLAPMIIAQEEESLPGRGSVQRISILSSSKCNAIISVFLSPSELREASISVPGGQCKKNTGDQLAAAATIKLQEAIDQCTNLNELEDADPDKNTDPAQPNFFHKDGQLCSRPIEIKITWDGSEYTLKWKGLSFNTGG